jgi:hypothetical protein
MTDLLLSPPWWLYCSIIAIGLFVWVSGNKRIDPRSRWIGIGIIALGAAMAVMSFLIETDVQKVNRQSKELVQAVVDQNWDKFKSLLAPDARFSIEGLPPRSRSRDDLLAGTKFAVAKYGLRSAGANIEETKKQDYIITTTIHVFSTGDLDPGHPMPSRWQFDWIKTPDGHWVISDIRALEIGNAKGSDMDTLIPHLPHLP